MARQVYELRVRGPVPLEVLQEIGAEDFGEEPPLTILRTEPTDQPGLHGMLQRLRSLGLDLMEVRTTGPDPLEVATPGTRPADGGAPCPSRDVPRSGAGRRRAAGRRVRAGHPRH